MNMDRFRRIQAENADLCERKNAAYGDKNLTRFGAVGLVVRMCDKMERLIHQVMDGGPADAETIRETAGDMANYATILQGVVDGTLFQEVEPRRPLKKSQRSGTTTSSTP